MRLSVVIPVFNRQALGERALTSALAQDVARMEIVVVDDGSTPPFRLPAEAEGAVRLIRNPKNLGESRARDEGIAASRGEWIAFLDSDDYWLPGTLAPRLEAAELAFAGNADPMI